MGEALGHSRPPENSRQNLILDDSGSGPGSGTSIAIFLIIRLLKNQVPGSFAQASNVETHHQIESIRVAVGRNRVLDLDHLDVPDPFRKGKVPQECDRALMIKTLIVQVA